jgi:nucleoside-diphosphate-sugar epimerase
MPTIELSPNTKVLVTGANGFIAMWVIKTLLDQGYAVRGVVRSEAKGIRLKECFKEHGEKLELVIVEDMMKVCIR